MNDSLKVQIGKLRKVSFYLFLFTNLAIFGTLFAHNILTSSKYHYTFYPFDSENLNNIECNKNNNFCQGYSWQTISNKLDKCSIYEVTPQYNVLGEINLKNEINKQKFETFLFDQNKKVKPEHKNSDIFVSFKKINIKTDACIKNYPISYSIYKVFPQIPNQIYKIKQNPKYFDGTKQVVNPFFYGETSISNIAKRFPLNLIFKPFLFISSLLIIIYWFYTKKIILTFNKSKKIEIYFILGVLSGVFLFLHVFFLGSGIENEIFKKLRRYIIAFFILFELMAQFFLIKRLLSIKKLINSFINNFFLKLKWYFVLFFLNITIIILCFLSIYELPKQVDYIIEWNYFVILSFYYFLTFYLWKKN